MPKLNFTIAIAALPPRPCRAAQLIVPATLTVLTAAVWTASTAITGSNLTALLGIGRCLQITLF